jgi:predicted MFS family arabinose efflux permease
MLNNQAAQVVGFAAGGALAANLGPRAVLALDAATFLVSIAVIGLAAPREAVRPAGNDEAAVPVSRRLRTVRTRLWDDGEVRALLALSALAGFFVAPEGLAVPLAQQWGWSTTRAGLLLAAIPLGSVLGVYFMVRRVRPARRVPVATVMAVLCGVPLVLSAPVASFPIAFACWTASGAFAAYQVEVISRIVQTIPDSVRAQTVGVVNAVLIGVQGLGVALFGVVADALSPARAVALAGALGTLAAIQIARTVLRDRQRPATAPCVSTDAR